MNWFHKTLTIWRIGWKVYKAIPRGDYCYRIIKHMPGGSFITWDCPMWSMRPDKPHQENGYCLWLGKGDWEENEPTLLWDQCKECGLKYNGEVVLEGMDEQEDKGEEETGL